MNSLNRLLGLVDVNVQKITSTLARYAKLLQAKNPALFEKELEDCYVDFINAYSAQGLYIVHNTMNHSCVSNAETTFARGDWTASIQAVKDIKKGEEIQINYLGARFVSNSSREVRRMRLKKEYCFDCRCDLCQSNK